MEIMGKGESNGTGEWGMTSAISGVVLVVCWVSLLSILLPLLSASLSVVLAPWTDEHALVSAGVLDPLRCDISSWVWRSSDREQDYQHNPER